MAMGAQALMTVAASLSASAFIGKGKSWHGAPEPVGKAGAVAPGEQAGEKHSPPSSKYSFGEHSTSIKYTASPTVAPPLWGDSQRAAAEAEKEKFA